MSWNLVIGQDDAVRRLQAAVSQPVHAYLLVGPSGVGKRRAATVFAGELLAAADPQRADRHRRLARDEKHPDVYILEPAGNLLRREEEAEPLIVKANLSPVEGHRKVLIVDRFHSATPAAAASLLKTIEEPPPPSIFVLLAEQVLPEHITIESRCTRVDFLPVTEVRLAEALVREGLCDTRQALLVAGAANGSVTRARVLATDKELAARRELWWSIPDRLDGTSAAIGILVAGVREQIDKASAGRAKEHKRELKALNEREERLGTRGSGRKDLEDRQKRELRQFRTEEIRFGLSTVANRYREAIIAGDERVGLFDSVDALRQTSGALIRNPNEALALQALLFRLCRL